jgi:hypothetical protein
MGRRRPFAPDGSHVAVAVRTSPRRLASRNSLYANLVVDQSRRMIFTSSAPRLRSGYTAKPGNRKQEPVTLSTQDLRLLDRTVCAPQHGPPLDLRQAHRTQGTPWCPARPRDGPLTHLTGTPACPPCRAPIAQRITQRRSKSYTPTRRLAGAYARPAFGTIRANAPFGDGNVQRHRRAVLQLARRRDLPHGP